MFFFTYFFFFFFGESNTCMRKPISYVLCVLSPNHRSNLRFIDYKASPHWSLQMYFEIGIENAIELTIFVLLSIIAV